MNQIISMSLYGTDERYQRGAIENAKVVKDVYPGWRLRIYMDDGIGRSVADQLHALGVDVRLCCHPGGIFPMFWRFWACSDGTVDTVVVRDSDSLLNAREKAAVDEWLASDKKYHVMRDHLDHAHWPMLGGMWGVRGGIPHIEKNIIGYGRWEKKLDDMHFLADVVWPHARHDMMHHSSVPTRHPDARPFPSHPPYTGFVGEIKY